jgi:hypothetical protein
MSVEVVFECCVKAIQEGSLIKRVSRSDKEFHFQHWFQARLRESGLHFEVGGRNQYPDIRMVASTDGYELKGLAYPGRHVDFDSNSQSPCGTHNGRTIYYVFGRYPKKPDGRKYPVLDLVICHGSFLNADHEYLHENKSVCGFGSYGDILIRDRKMYVVPTPFNLAAGLAHQQTLILPAEVNVGAALQEVGELRRKEAAELLVGYSFDLKSNELLPKWLPNPGAGRNHLFRAWRRVDCSAEKVSMSTAMAVSEEEVDNTTHE